MLSESMDTTATQPQAKPFLFLRSLPLPSLWALATWAYLILVILWGAYVRLSGSGAGCGEHWPLCNGEVIPTDPSTRTLIELTHRITSGLSLLLVGWMVRVTFKTFPTGHPARKAAVASGILIVIEALIGAFLVLLGLVGANDTIRRAISMALHLVNTFLLIGSVVATFQWSRLPRQPFGKLQWPSWRWWLSAGTAFLLFFAIGSSGGVTALGDTLFPKDHVGDGLSQFFSQAHHFLDRFRALHPFLALSGTAYFFIYIHYLKESAQYQSLRRVLSTASLLLFLQVLLGFTNIILKVPTTLAIAHLLIANLLGTCLFLLWIHPFYSRTPASDA